MTGGEPSPPPSSPPAGGHPPPVRSRARRGPGDEEEDRSFRELLRSLRAGGGESPPFDPATAPAEPLPLFRQWLRDAARAGEPEPHTMSLATADASGRPSVRTVMLHDADARGWHFGTHRTSRKGRELAHRAYAALGFYWPATGRQVRVGGPVAAATPAESAADLRGRSPAALAAALVGRQSEVLDSYQELVRAAEAARERVAREPGATAPGWTLYVLEPEEVEFYQGERDRRHLRLRYLRERAGGAAGPAAAVGPADAMGPVGAGGTAGPATALDGAGGAGGGSGEGGAAGGTGLWRRELLWP